MGPYLGDFERDSVVCFCWDTHEPGGTSVSRTVDGTIKVYREDETGECVAGITDVEDFDGVTGVHNCKIDLGSDAFYASGKNYSVVLTGATIAGHSVNAVLAVFSIEKRFSASELFSKSAKLLVNKAVQDKVSGKIDYYDNDGETILLTHTPEELETTITRMPN